MLFFQLKTIICFINLPLMQNKIYMKSKQWFTLWINKIVDSIYENCY